MAQAACSRPPVVAEIGSADPASIGGKAASGAAVRCDRLGNEIGPAPRPSMNVRAQIWVLVFRWQETTQQEST